MSEKPMDIHSLKNTLLLKNANYHMSLLWVIFFFFAIVTSKIIHHRSVIITMNKFELFWKLLKCGTENEMSKCGWKNGTGGLAQFRVSTKLQFVKNAVSARLSEVKCSWVTCNVHFSFLTRLKIRKKAINIIRKKCSSGS